MPDARQSKADGEENRRSFVWRIKPDAAVNFDCLAFAVTSGQAKPSVAPPTMLSAEVGTDHIDRSRTSWTGYGAVLKIQPPIAEVLRRAICGNLFVKPSMIVDTVGHAHVGVPCLQDAMASRRPDIIYLSAGNDARSR
jgi:hypothetical protein